MLSCIHTKAYVCFSNAGILDANSCTCVHADHKTRAFWRSVASFCCRYMNVHLSCKEMFSNTRHARVQTSFWMQNSTHTTLSPACGRIREMGAIYGAWMGAQIANNMLITMHAKASGTHHDENERTDRFPKPADVHVCKTAAICDAWMYAQIVNASFICMRAETQCAFCNAQMHRSTVDACAYTFASAL